MSQQKEGFAVRADAIVVLDAILNRAMPFDEAMASARILEPRDRGFLASIVLTTLRHKEAIDTLLGNFLSKPLPRKSGSTTLILQSGAAQLLFLESPPYAVIDTAVALARKDSNATHFAGLINAVLRKVAAEGKPRLDGIAPRVAPWLMARWVKSYGAALAAEIAAASLKPAALDITVKSDAGGWAKRLGGKVLPTGSIRLSHAVADVEQLSGFDEGAWWVQDAASAMPARLLGDVAGRRVADLCAAPGGKTLQLAASGAKVTAVDSSARRLSRLQRNLARTQLTAELLTADVLQFDDSEPFDAVLLDAPCSATGTVRRHPDLPYLKSAQQIGELMDLQARMLARMRSLVKPGGLLVYCTCSLEPEEGEAQITRFLAANPEFVIEPLRPGDSGLDAHFISHEGHFRSLPTMAIGDAQGLDGFFAARLRRR